VPIAQQPAEAIEHIAKADFDAIVQPTFTVQRPPRTAIFPFLSIRLNFQVKRPTDTKRTRPANPL
jgi:hypothetical protein